MVDLNIPRSHIPSYLRAWLVSPHRGIQNKDWLNKSYGFLLLGKIIIMLSPWSEIIFSSMIARISLQSRQKNMINFVCKWGNWAEWDYMIIQSSISKIITQISWLLCMPVLFSFDKITPSASRTGAFLWIPHHVWMSAMTKHCSMRVKFCNR